MIIKKKGLGNQTQMQRVRSGNSANIQDVLMLPKQKMDIAVQITERDTIAEVVNGILKMLEKSSIRTQEMDSIIYIS